MNRFVVSACALVACLGCQSPKSASGVDGALVLPEAKENWQRDILSTDLRFNIEGLSGSALVTFAGDLSNAASLDVGDLEISSVQSDGRDLKTLRDGTRLDIGLPDTGSSVSVDIVFGFQAHSGFEGYRAQGSTVTWPSFCGNLFPCTTDPADGATYSLAVDGVPDGELAVYPQKNSGQAPSYSVAFAVGDYSYVDLGLTTAGTKIGAYYLPGGRAKTESGTEFLPDYVDFFEERYGPYSFGDTVAAVAVNWGFGAAGGIEHHPYFHVASSAMNSHEIQAHETAHGWFGNGVRIACWEDFVLSEGVAQYLTLRAIEHAEGVDAAGALWTTISDRLQSAVATRDTIAYPQGCNQIDILTDPLWSRIPYEKGAFFLRAVEERMGRAELDAALASFYQANVGQARHMSDLLAAIEGQADVNIDDLVQGWLRSLGIPK